MAMAGDEDERRRSSKRETSAAEGRDKECRDVVAILLGNRPRNSQHDIFHSLACRPGATREQYRK